MAYLSERFPTAVAPAPVGGPSFSTQVNAVLSGEEKRNQNWSRSRHEYEVSHGIRTEAAFVQIGAHFRMARGRAHHFRYKDWGDFTVARLEGELTLLTTTTFQIYKVYGDVMGFEERRKITRPVSGTVSVWQGTVLQTLGSNYTVAVETGIVTFAIAPGMAVIEVACQFDVPVRYDTDTLKATLIRANNLGGQPQLKSWTSVPLVEVKE